MLGRKAWKVQPLLARWRDLEQGCEVMLDLGWMQRIETHQVGLADIAWLGRLLQEIEEAPRAKLLLERAVVKILPCGIGPHAGAWDQGVLRSTRSNQRLGKQPRQFGFALPHCSSQNDEWVGLQRDIIVDDQGARKWIARSAD